MYQFHVGAAPAAALPATGGGVWDDRKGRPYAQIMQNCNYHSLS